MPSVKFYIGIGPEPKWNREPKFGALAENAENAEMPKMPKRQNAEICRKY